MTPFKFHTCHPTNDSSHFPPSLARLKEPVLDSKFYLKYNNRSSHRGEAEMNLTMNNEVVGLIPGLDQWVKDPVLL